MDDADEAAFVVTPEARSDGAGATIVGGTALSAAERDRRLRQHVGNPDDPSVSRAPLGSSGPRSGPDYTGTPGQLAIVQGQVYIVGVILVAQLWLITTALFELLSGRIGVLWPMAIASLVGFLVALVVFLWPRRATGG
ncbi:MAG: hypothetical protein IVW57_00870 [Ktedonobacterales bacterium]|nr:hypothetical protein [Ktedonobacterales bacterium]